MKKSMIWLGFFVLLLLWACAHRVAPSGGPEDKTPPEVVRTVPEAGALQVKDLQEIELEFSENIQRNSFPDNWWLVPDLGITPQIKWKGGRKVYLRFPQSLPDSLTFVLTLGKGIKDLHGNSLARPFQLAFSTGNRINRNAITGQVYGFRKTSELFLYAYRISRRVSIDSLLGKKALYYTQTDDSGNFRFNYLPDGTFRVFAIEDLDLNRLYTLESDLIGIPFTDVHLDSVDSVFLHLNFWMIQEDTTAPAVKSPDTLSTRQIQIEFDEPVFPTTQFRVTVQDTEQSQEYPVLGYSFLRKDSTRLALYFRNLPPGRPCRITLQGIRDRAGNVPEDELTTICLTPHKQDTLPPAFVKMNPSHGAEGIPYTSSILLEFNTPLDTSTFLPAVVITDEEGDTLSGKFDFRDLTAPLFQPDTLLKKDTRYTVTLQLSQMRDLFGRAFPDTVRQLSFSTISWTELGEISGRVLAQDTSYRRAMVQAIATEKKTVYTTFVRVGEEFEIPFLPAGKYLLRAIIDRNGNGRWDKGSTHPFQFAEPFVVSADTVKVRKRWTTQGKVIRFFHK